MRPHDAAAGFGPPELLQGLEGTVAEQVVLEGMLGAPVGLRCGRVGADPKDRVALFGEFRVVVVKADGLDGAAAGVGFGVGEDRDPLGLEDVLVLF